MVYSAVGGSTQHVTVEIATGSHVFVNARGEQYAEWSELTEEQQQKLISAGELLDRAFNEAGEMLRAVGLPAGSGAVQAA